MLGLDLPCDTVQYCLQVGGVDQLLELVETGVGITEHKTRSYPLAIYYGEDDQPEVGPNTASA